MRNFLMLSELISSWYLFPEGRVESRVDWVLGIGLNLCLIGGHIEKLIDHEILKSSCLLIWISPKFIHEHCVPGTLLICALI